MSPTRRTPWMAAVAAIMGVVVSVSACSSGPFQVSAPRPLVVQSGVRLRPDSTRMDEVNQWVEVVNTTITEDPSFWIITNTVPEEAYPWETLSISTESALDTAMIAIEPRAPDARLSYNIYAFLHLMRASDRIGEFFPEAASLNGFDLERFILQRAAESWLLGRSIFDTQPYPPLDELAYAAELGYLDALILTARPDDFAAARGAYLSREPDGLEAYQDWFDETFGRPPPGMREG